MPGVGPRSAERIALWMVQTRDSRPLEIARSITEAAAKVHPCAQCGFFAVEPHCEICAERGARRVLATLCRRATDRHRSAGTVGGVPGIDTTHLGGRISPLDHIGPEDLRIDALLDARS